MSSNNAMMKFDAFKDAILENGVNVEWKSDCCEMIIDN